jgi:hypothetical protein
MGRLSWDHTPLLIPAQLLQSFPDNNQGNDILDPALLAPDKDPIANKIGFDSGGWRPSWDHTPQTLSTTLWISMGMGRATIVGSHTFLSWDHTPAIVGSHTKARGITHRGHSYVVEL